MTIQIANPDVIAKIERLAKLTGMTKTSAVEQAVDLLLSQRTAGVGKDEDWRRLDALLEQFDRVPEVEQPFDPLYWGDQGLPQ
jgi:antitoxin VapB